jgi:hypothetical protein
MPAVRKVRLRHLGVDYIVLGQRAAGVTKYNCFTLPAILSASEKTSPKIFGRLADIFE